MEFFNFALVVVWIHCWKKCQGRAGKMAVCVFKEFPFVWLSDPVGKTEFRAKNNECSLKWAQDFITSESV